MWQDTSQCTRYVSIHGLNNEKISMILIKHSVTENTKLLWECVVIFFAPLFNYDFTRSHFISVRICWAQEEGEQASLRHVMDWYVNLGSTLLIFKNRKTFQAGHTQFSKSLCAVLNLLPLSPSHTTTGQLTRQVQLRLKHPVTWDPDIHPGRHHVPVTAFTLFVNAWKKEEV